METYLMLVNELRLAAKLPIYSKQAQNYFSEAADAIEALVKRIQRADEVLTRATERLKSINDHMRDAIEANEEIRSA